MEKGDSNANTDPVLNYKKTFSAELYSAQLCTQSLQLARSHCPMAQNGGSYSHHTLYQTSEINTRFP